MQTENNIKSLYYKKKLKRYLKNYENYEIYHEIMIFPKNYEIFWKLWKVMKLWPVGALPYGILILSAIQ